MSLLISQDSAKPVYEIPLTFEPNISYKQVIVTLPEASYSLYFNLNTVEVSGVNVYLSCLSADETVKYFGSYRCVFGTYINYVDAGSLHKFFFYTKDTSVDTPSTITFDNLNTTVGFYAVLR